MQYPGNPIRAGDRGEHVAAIQAALGVQQTSLFGPTTQQHVIAFQESHGLQGDGVVGPLTWAALFPSVDAFHLALAFTLKWEGGYVNHPLDPGGATNRGITQDTYNRYLRSKRQQLKSVRFISTAEVEDIYRRRYWQLAGCHKLPLPLSVAVFDLAVNCGVGAAKKLLSGLSGNPKHMSHVILDRRMAYYRAIVRRRPKSHAFMAGWTNRVNALREYIKRL